MPRVQYSHPQRDINVTKPMAPPSNVSQIKSWCRAAKKVIPDLPNCWSNNGSWQITRELVTDTMIALELHHKQTHERCGIVFDRKYNNITGR